MIIIKDHVNYNGFIEEFLVHENLLKEKAKQVKQEKKEEKEREAALAFEADFSSHHNVHMTSTTIPTLVAQTLGAPVRSRLHTVIRRAERMTALTGWHDLINAGLTQEAANEAMKEFMDQVDDPQHILRPDHEYRQEFAPLGDPTIADSPPPVSSDAYTSVTDTDNLDSDIFTDGDRYETLFAEPETNEEEGEDDEEEDEKNEDDEEDEDDEEEEDEDEDEE